ncbi:MAG: S8 family serine peptidase [Thiotrichales bacterium]|nr:S8 family serine peptidase [Thiotrichales bacterium]
MVLEQVGAHHAYARDLTGSGVRIGIEDSIVDYTQRAEFGNRVRTSEADGASLVYWRPPGRENSYDAVRCQFNPRCVVYTIDSQGDENAYNQAVEEIVRRDGWPLRDDETFLVDDHYSEFDPIDRLYRAYEVPTPYGEGSHGTAVASTAAGRNLGIAPDAIIIPTTINLTDDQEDGSLVAAELLSLAISLPPAERTRLDQELAGILRNDYAKFDIINRSFGPDTPPNPVADASAVADSDRFLTRHLPSTRRAFVQLDRAPDDRTVIVYAAGNKGHERPNPETALPYYLPDVRGHHVAVAATDPSTKRIARYSDRCGPLPSNWNRSRHGRHFCLVAPGTVRVLQPDARTPGQGRVEVDGGTSYAAPIVSGALALMMEHFRGTQGNTAIVRRMMDTADRTGVYANSAIYGAGHLDLEAALSPVGGLSAGQGTASLGSSRLSTPSAFGAVGDRLGGAEVATFDAQGFPFWIPASDLVSASGTSGSAIPAFDDPMGEAPGAGLETLSLAWSEHTTDTNSPLGEGFTFGFGPGSASVARTSDGNRWGWGASFADGSYLGSRASGAFGHDLRSGMVWASRSFNRELGRGVTFHAGVTLAAGRADYESDAMFEATPSLMSAASVRVASRGTSLTLESPMRAESGTGTFRLETGHVEDGVRQRETVRVGLRPDGRELRATLRHDTPLAVAGRIAVEGSVAHDAGHTAGAREGRIGLAWNVTW